MEHTENTPKWPIIINETLTGSEIYKILQQRGHKLRVLLQDAVNEWQPSKVIGKVLISRISQLTETHKQCYVLASAPLHGKQEQELLTTLQKQFMSSHVSFLPVHNSADCVEAMTTIAKVTCPPLRNVVRQRFDGLIQKQVTEDTLLSIIAQTGMTEHECLVLLDGRGSLSTIAASSVDQLLDCSLSTRSANVLSEFFSQDCLL
ncbi:protein SPO16 homolog isoform X2 [Dysidea avara]|uniref:protein SPO16 homolog isoform X2 n=1 Tax=Dysidea avara TaxID=196820 RepID=UPI00332EC4FC